MNTHLNSLIPLIPLITPFPALLAILLPAQIANRSGKQTGRFILLLTSLSFFLAILSTLNLCLYGGVIHHTFASWGTKKLPTLFGLTVYFDTISAIMLLLVSFLGISVTSFSQHYLGGNPRRGEFFRWLSVTIGCVLLLIISGNLALFTLSWMAISLSLHQLLTFYKDRIGAILAARKKALFSRLGDLCLIAALFISWHDLGTFDYAHLFASADHGLTHSIHWIAIFLIGAAMLKSAQFPFHGWLPDTMETPTPVSALMHAGIINAGGFLIIRFSPLIALSPQAMELLAAIGGFTALFGSLIMITQTSVKRSLAFSTISQMGFMMLQCGLGAFALALLHIVAHSLYKAHAFLSSGSVIAQHYNGAPPSSSYRGVKGAILSFSVAILLVVGGTVLFAIVPWNDSGTFGLSLILAIALAQLLWHWWSMTSSTKGIVQGLAIAAGLCLLSFALHQGTAALINHCVAHPTTFSLSWPIAIVTAAAFFFLALRVFLPPSWNSTRIGSALFVHAYNGFYVNTLANRLLSFIQPIKRS